MSGFAFRLKPPGAALHDQAASRSSSADVGRDRLGSIGLEPQDEVGRLRRRAGSAHDGAVVLAQHFEPRGNIVGMAHGRGDAERGAKISGGNLRALS